MIGIIIIDLLVGCISGFLAARIMNINSDNWILNCLLGLIGGVVGGILGKILQIGANGIIGGIIFSVLGACIVVYLYKILKK